LDETAEPVSSGFAAGVGWVEQRGGCGIGDGLDVDPAVWPSFVVEQ
jgi:hypothetical protein